MIEKLIKLANFLDSIDNDMAANVVDRYVLKVQGSLYDLNPNDSVYPLYGSEKNTSINIKTHPIARMMSDIIKEIYLVSIGHGGFINRKNIEVLASEAIKYDVDLNKHLSMQDNKNPLTIAQFEQILALTAKETLMSSIKAFRKNPDPKDIETFLGTIYDAYEDQYLLGYMNLEQSEKLYMKNEEQTASKTHPIEKAPYEDAPTEILNHNY